MENKILKYWQAGAEDAMDTTVKLFKAKKYHHALFFLHLALEKAIKAIYVSRKNQAPPPRHDLILQKSYPRLC